MTVTDVEAFERLDASTRDFSEALREGRCRPSGRFRRGIAMGVLEPLRGAWSLEILFLLYMHGPLRFGQAKASLQLSSRVLTDKLRDLAASGLVERREEGRAVAYSVTPHGEVIARHLHPIVFFLGAGLEPPAGSRRA